MLMLRWWVGRPVQGRGSIGAMIGGRGLGTTSELIIALPAQPPQPTAYITTVAVSVRSIDILVSTLKYMEYLKSCFSPKKEYNTQS